MILIRILLVKRIGDLERSIRTRNDKAHQHRLKERERIFKTYQSFVMNVLEVVEKKNLLLYIKNEKNPTFLYNVFLKTYYCNCPDRVSICKHIFEGQSIIKDFFENSEDDELMEEILHIESNIKKYRCYESISNR